MDLSPLKIIHHTVYFSLCFFSLLKFHWISLQTKKKRKRCGECIGCQKKDNCGDCAPCRNDKSHQICKQRRCEKLTDKKVSAAIVLIANFIHKRDYAKLNRRRSSPLFCTPSTFHPLGSELDFYLISTFLFVMTQPVNCFRCELQIAFVTGCDVGKWFRIKVQNVKV